MLAYNVDNTMCTHTHVWVGLRLILPKNNAHIHYYSEHLWYVGVMCVVVVSRIETRDPNSVTNKNEKSDKKDTKRENEQNI